MSASGADLTIGHACSTSLLACLIGCRDVVSLVGLKYISLCFYCVLFASDLVCCGYKLGS